MLLLLLLYLSVFISSSVAVVFFVCFCRSGITSPLLPQPRTELRQIYLQQPFCANLKAIGPRPLRIELCRIDRKGGVELTSTRASGRRLVSLQLAPRHHALVQHGNYRFDALHHGGNLSVVLDRQIRGARIKPPTNL